VTDTNDGGEPTSAGTAAPSAPAGWYPDPWSPGRHRYWNGGSWTTDVLVSSPPEWAAPPAAGDGWPAAPTTGDAWPVPPETVPFESTLPYSSEREAPQPPVKWIALLAGMTAMAVLGALIALAIHSPRKSRPAAATGPVPTLPASPGQTLPGGGGTLPGGGGTTPTVSPDPDQSVLDQVVAHQADVTGTNAVGLIPAGDQVAGQTTLDLCNGTFPSEVLRTARRQVAVADDQGNVSFSTEAVLYQTPDAAAQAFAELKSVAAKCPSTPVQSQVGEPTVKTTFNPTPDGSWPQTASVDRLAYDFVSTDDQGQTHHAIAVYLRRGRVLMGLYFQQPDGPQPSIGGQTSFPGIVTVFANRLAQLPADVINRTFIPPKSA
jgi:hypothetical protein